MSAAASTANIFTRDDTFLGICQAIGDDFGFNANWLRLALAAPIIWYPTMMLSIYFALGAAVLVSRLAFPARRWRLFRKAKAAPQTAAGAAAPAAPARANDGALAEVLAAAA